MNLELLRFQIKSYSIFYWVILLFFIAFGMFLRFEALSSVHIGTHEWLTRDIDRALNIVDGNYIPLAGPESYNGGRLPGPFMYLFLTIPLIINRTYESIFVFNLVLNISSIIGLFYVLKSYVLL